MRTTSNLEMLNPFGVVTQVLWEFDINLQLLGRVHIKYGLGHYQALKFDGI